MVYHTTDAYGISEINPSPQRMCSILESLKEAEDAEHPDVWLTNDDNGWSLTYSRNAVMILEHLDSDVSPRYMRKVAVPQALEMWQQLAKGDVKTLLALGWSRS